MLAYADFTRQHRRRTRDEFFRTIRTPHLLITWCPDESQQAGLFATQDTSTSPLPNLDAPLQSAVAALRRRRSTGAGLVLGRSATADLVVPCRVVSKEHACFVRTSEGWTVTDLGSTNGTTFDGTHLPPNEPRRIVSGTTLTLGDSVLVEVLDPSDLYRRLHAPEL